MNDRQEAGKSLSVHPFHAKLHWGRPNHSHTSMTLCAAHTLTWEEAWWEELHVVAQHLLDVFLPLLLHQAQGLVMVWLASQKRRASIRPISKVYAFLYLLHLQPVIISQIVVVLVEEGDVIGICRD